MKSLLKDYTFSASGKTITFTNYTAIELARIYAVINVTRSVFYFKMGDSVLKGTVATNVLTLDSGTSTSGHADADKLVILYDDHFAIDNLPNQSPFRPMGIGGKAVNSSSYSPAYTADDSAAAAFDKDNGGLNVNQADLNAAYDSVKNYPGISSDNTVHGNYTSFRSTTVNSTAQTVKGSAGNIAGIRITNKDTNIIYIKLYNKTGATSSDTPFATYPVPTGAGSFRDVNFPIPRGFDVACSVRAVTGVADNDTTAPGTLPIIEVDYL